MSGLPVLSAPPNPLPSVESTANGSRQEPADAHLQSTKAVNGYHIEATDGTIGHVCDFMMNDQSWAIAQLVIKTGHRFSGKEVRIPTSAVQRISYDESKIFVNLTKEEVEQSTIGHAEPTVATV